MREGGRQMRDESTRKAVPAHPVMGSSVNPRFSAGDGVAWTGGKVGAGRVCVHGGNGNREPMIEWEASAAWRIVSPGWTEAGR
jgi:hypothetical protein